MTNADNLIRTKNEASYADNDLSIKNKIVNHRSWVLPDGYDDLPPKDKQEVLRETCLRYIEKFGATHRAGKGWHKNWTWRNKKQQYSMFDDVIIHVFYRKNIPVEMKR